MNPPRHKKQNHQTHPAWILGKPLMNNSKSQPFGARFPRALNFSLALVAALMLSCAPAASAASYNENRAPDVPSSLQVPEDNKVSFHTYAVGVQIYRATPSATSPTGF